MQSVPAGLAPPRTSPSGRLPFALHTSILMALLAASSAPTPLYPHYQAQWRLSSLDITVVFSAYALALLIALLTRVHQGGTPPPEPQRSAAAPPRASG